jgi:hypothetical protein
MIASLALGTAPIVWVVVSMTVYHTGLMLAMPQSIAGAMTPFPTCAGTASSLIGFTQQTSAATIGMLVGHGIGQSGQPLAIAVAAMGCLSLAFWIGTRRIRATALIDLDQLRSGLPPTGGPPSQPVRLQPHVTHSQPAEDAKSASRAQDDSSAPLKAIVNLGPLPADKHQCPAPGRV